MRHAPTKRKPHQSCTVVLRKVGSGNRCGDEPFKCCDSSGEPLMSLSVIQSHLKAKVFIGENMPVESNGSINRADGLPYQK